MHVGGVKHCSVKGCFYTVSSREYRPCPEHSKSTLNIVKDCPVEFIYVWPVDNKDKRRWLSGLVRTGNLASTNFHNHSFHGPTKVPAKIVYDIQHALQIDPTLKTHDIVTGKFIVTA